MDLLCAWFAKWLLNVNTQKSAVMVFRSRKMPPVHLRITANSASVHQVRCHRHLGIHLNGTLTWSDHVVSVISKASARIGFLRRLSPQLDSITLRELYTKCIRPSLEYGSIVWSGLQTMDADLLEKYDRRAAHLILKVRTSTPRDLPPDLLLARAGISRLEPRRKLEQVTFCIRVFCKKLPAHLQESISR